MAIETRQPGTSLTVIKPVTETLQAETVASTESKEKDKRPYAIMTVGVLAMFYLGTELIGFIDDYTPEELWSLFLNLLQNPN